MIKTDDIFLFVNVVDEASFSKAAEKLSLTNSVVSKRINRLENALNVQLLYRTTRRLNMTEAGKVLYSKARVARVLLQDAQDAVAGYADEIRGTIKLTVPSVSSRLILNRAVATFCQTYPGVHIDLSVNNQLVDLINDGFDLAIRTGHLEDSSLIARRLIDSKWIVCASPEYIHLNGEIKHPQELQTRQCLIYKYAGKDASLWPFKVNNKPLTVQVQGRYQANSLDALREAALANFGIAFLPRALIYEELNSGALISLLESYSDKSQGIYAVYPKTRQPDKKLQLLISHFHQAYQSKSACFC